MTPRRLRQHLFGSLVALHAALTLCGPSLHMLPGAGDHARPILAVEGDPSFEPSGASHAASDHCPICDFLSQAKSLIEASPGASAPLVMPFGAVERPLVSSPALHRPSHPRAPPAPSAYLS